MITINKIRSQHKHKAQSSLSDEVIKSFIASDINLREAITQAEINFNSIMKENPEYLELEESELVQFLGKSVFNMYSPLSTFPYVPLAAKGPWIVTFHGGVVYDLGGYGMLGFGHNPDFLNKTLAKPQVMANFKTRSFSQSNFIEKIKSKIRKGNCPYKHFAYLNSGSEAVALAARVAEINGKNLTDKNAKYHGRSIKYLSLEGSFHGRTIRGAEASDSTLDLYKSTMSSFTNSNKLITVEPNNINQLKEIFKSAENNNIFIEATFIEPVMGEGKAGYGITPEFYSELRKLTKEHQSIFIMDSIQAGLRTHGVLSVLDYPGFEKLEVPDIETFSKALNAGQYPLSIIAFNDKAESVYVAGAYGNTMTGNPRALDIASCILDNFNEDVSNNIVEVGRYFKSQLLDLQTKYPNSILEVLGEGLLVSAKLSEDIEIEGESGIELSLRLSGLSVIHGAGNRLRFTPWFNINKSEVDLVVNLINGFLAKKV